MNYNTNYCPGCFQDLHRPCEPCVPNRHPAPNWHCPCQCNSGKIVIDTNNLFYLAIGYIIAKNCK